MFLDHIQVQVSKTTRAKCFENHWTSPKMQRESQNAGKLIRLKETRLLLQPDSGSLNCEFSCHCSMQCQHT